MIGINRIHQLMVVLPFLVFPSLALAQQPSGANAFGIGDLFKKLEEPAGEQPPVPIDRALESVERCDRYLATGVALWNDRRLAEAEVQYAAAAVLAGRPDGDPHRLVLALYYQASVVAYQGRVDEARSLIEKATESLPRVIQLLPDHLEFMFGLATKVYEVAGQPSDLEPVLRKLLSLELRIFGEDHPVVSQHANYLGENLIQQGKFVNAENLFSVKLSRIEKNFGAASPELDEAVDWLLLVYQKQSKDAESISLVQKILARREEQLGQNHERVADTLDAYARLLRKSGKDAVADRIAARSLLIRSRNGLLALIASSRAASSIGRLNRSGS